MADVKVEKNISSSDSTPSKAVAIQESEKVNYVFVHNE